MMKDVYRTKNSCLKGVTSKKRIVKQQTQRNPTFNSTMNVLKRSKPREQPTVTVKRNVIPVKLPTIVKKTPPTSNISFSSAPKPIPSAYIQKSS